MKLMKANNQDDDDGEELDDVGEYLTIFFIKKRLKILIFQNLDRAFAPKIK